jgi:hypothetical protein
MLAKSPEINFQNATKYIKKYSWLVLMTAIGSYWILPFLSKPFVIDEAAFPYAAQGVSENWTPYFYNGETRPNDLGIWHPPLYVYLLGMWVKILGFSPELVRLFGILCLIATSILIKMTINLLRPNTKIPGLVGMGLYSTHYFVLQSSMIPDIDGTLLPLVISFCTFAITRYYLSSDTDNKNNYLLIIFALGLCFSTKLTTSLILVSFIFIIEMQKSSKLIGSILKTSFLTICGFLFFISWWYPLAKAKNLNWFEPIDFTVKSFRGKSSNASLLTMLESSIMFPRSALAWIGPITFVSVLILITVIFFNRKLNHRSYLFALLYLSIVIWGTYNAITGAPFTFPKYWNVPIVTLSILLGTLWSTNVRKSKSYRSYKILTPCILLVILCFALYSQTQSNLAEKTNFDVLTNAFWLVPFAVAVFILAIKKNFLKIKLQEHLIIFATLSILMSSFISNTALSQQDFSTRYYFGEKGEGASIARLNEISTPGTRIMAAKDVGLQSGLPFYEDAILLNQFPAKEIVKYLMDEKIEFIIVRKLYDYSALVYPDHFMEINKQFKVIDGGIIGDFEIWRHVGE